MLDLAWSEFFVIGLVAVVVLGPKELPKAMKTMAQFTKKARKLAGEFQGHWNDMLREAEVEDVKKTVQQISNVSVGSEVGKLIDPTGEFGKELDDAVGTLKSEVQSTVAVADQAAVAVGDAAGPSPTATASTPPPAAATPATPVAASPPAAPANAA